MEARVTSLDSYLEVEGLLGLVDEPNRSLCRKLWKDNRSLFENTSGSSHNHQAWPGGYVDHIRECMSIGLVLYNRFSSLRPLPFSRSDILLVMFLHDLEKPWKYQKDKRGKLEHKPDMRTKEAQRNFREQKMREYGIWLTCEQYNAIRYAEGEGNDYSNKRRIMGPLAALANMCDVASARLWYDYPSDKHHPWVTASRATPTS